ncbi:DUF3592 domain-containing protein [Rhodocyclus tenuis]|uniref:DUF3592 domain-containing protein n=1 Tax=Rhodocyclus tenuis TaxID=1066 RepID=UPI0019044B8F|nr:hypothetical protein [Rhodocyclus tenuis]
MLSSTPQGKASNIFVAVFFSFTALFSLWAFTSSVNAVINVSVAATWPVVDGVIVSSKVRPACKGLAYYLPFVNYRYTVERQEYVGRRIAFGANICSTESNAARITNVYSEGKSVQVHFDPASPEESALDVSRTESGTWPVFIFALLIFAISLPIAYHFLKLCLTSQSTGPARKTAQSGDF